MTTLWGRRRQIPELRARNYQVRTLGERLAVNTVIQGTAADIIKLAMVRTHRALADSGLQHAAAADDPRRAAVRRPARGGASGARADRARDGRRVGAARAAAGGRHRRQGAPGWRRSEPRPGRCCGRRRPACLVGMQAPINSRLGKMVGTLQAATLLVPRRHRRAGAITSIVSGGLGALGERRDGAVVGARRRAARRRLRDRWRWSRCARSAPAG